MLKSEISKYKTIVFDCDGVVLNSNKIKTQAFYETTKHYGHEQAQALVDFHIQNGGISRYIKIEYFLTDILGKELKEKELKGLLENFSDEVKKSLLNCEIASGLELLREKTKDANWLIVSGGDQNELREVFTQRGINKLFDGGIFGSPDDKKLILAREIEQGNISENAIFLGDSKYDFEASQSCNMDFLFISDWTEVNNWHSWCESNVINEVKKLNDLNEVVFKDGVQFYINKEVFIHPDTKITNKGVNNKIFLHYKSSFGKNSPIRVEFIGSFNSISLSKMSQIKRGHCRFTGNRNKLSFGKKTTVGNSYFLVDNGTKINLGEDCMVSYQVEFRTTDAHSLLDTETGKLINQPQGISLGNHVWVGKGALIMQGVMLGNNIVVGTRATVTKSFNEENIAIAGVPAKIVRKNVGWDRSPPK